MKKTPLIVAFLLLSTSFSCQEKENAPAQTIDFEEVSAFFQEMMRESLEFSGRHLELRVDENGQTVMITNPDAISTFLKANYFPDIPDTFTPLGKSNLRSASDDGLSISQKLFMDRLDSAMQMVQSDLDFYSSIDYFRNEALSNPTLSDEDRLFALAVVEYTSVLHESILEGVFSSFVSQIKENVEGSRIGNDECPPNRNCPMQLSYCDQDPQQCSGGGGGGCSIDWRSVWGGAVAGLAIGATRGAIAGAAAGTVVFPFVGTVTGAVNAGVVGGAYGFIEGAAVGVAVSLLLTCGR